MSVCIAAGQEIILRDSDEPVTAQAGGSTFYGGDLDGISEKLPYTEKTWRDGAVSKYSIKAPSVHKYDTEDYRHVDPQFGGDGALLRLPTQYAAAGNTTGAGEGVFNHSGDSRAAV
ncbi:alpha-amylase family glycosyl hydrolase [Shigella flexneri]